MIEQNPLKVFLKSQDESLLQSAKYWLAFFCALLAATTFYLYNNATLDCNGYQTCLLLLIIYHILDSLGYIHEGMKVTNFGKGLFNSEAQPDFSKFKQKDLIYINKKRG